MSPPLAERLFGTVGEVTRLFREMSGKEEVYPVLEREPECILSRLGTLSGQAGGRVADAGGDSVCLLMEKVCHELVVAYCRSTGYYAIGP